MPLLFPVILGSVRRDRQGIKAARYIIDKLEARGDEAVLIDPCEKELPLLDRMYKEHPKGEAPPLLEELAELYRRADGFVIVTAEYNQSVPPALKNLLDHFSRSISGAPRRSSPIRQGGSAACGQPWR